MSDSPEALPSPLPVAEVTAPSATVAVLPDAGVAPVEAPPAAEAPSVVEATPVAEAAPAVAAKPRAKSAKPQVSEDTLNAWQQRLEQDRAEQRHRQQVANARTERQQAFRLARRAIAELASAENATVDPALAALADDQLACDVHAAPERIRTVIAATLRMLQKNRR